MDTLDFEAAKKQAKNCVETISGFKRELIHRWNQYQENKVTVDYFQGEAAKLFGELAKIYISADNAMNVDVLAALTKIHGKIDIPPAQVHGRKFDTWHEASIDILYGLLSVPVAVAENAELWTPVIAKKQVIPTPSGTIISLWRPENTRRLESVLLALEVDKNAYWKRVADGVRNYPHENADGIKVYLENEWACALKTDDNSTSAKQHVKNQSATHSPDFSQVTWHEKTYLFTKMQARAVEILWTAWETGGATVSGA